MKQLAAGSNNLQLKKKILISIFMLFAIHCLLLTAHADDVRARSAIVMEESTGRVLYGKNPNLKLAPASTTKLVTAMVVLDRIDINKVVTISDKATGVSPVKANFRAGEKTTVKTLLHAALIKSANDAAFALAEAAGGSEENFVDLMNQKVLALGLADTRFINSTGLPGKGQHTTAYDLARIMRNALKYPAIRDIINIKTENIATEDGRTIFLKNVNRLLWADESLIGGKTGYTRQARHCFVCAGEHNKGTVIVALLGAPTRDELWKESEALLDKGFAVKDKKEEPAVYFTKSDYKSSLQEASYKPGESYVRKAAYKSHHKVLKVKSKRHARKKKKQNQATVASKENYGIKG